MISIVENGDSRTNINNMTKSEVIYDLVKSYIISCDNSSYKSNSSMISTASSMYNELVKSGVIKEERVYHA